MLKGSDQEPILAIKNFDRRRSWKYRVYCSDYPLCKRCLHEDCIDDEDIDVNGKVCPFVEHNYIIFTLDTSIQLCNMVCIKKNRA